MPRVTSGGGRAVEPAALPATQLPGYFEPALTAKLSGPRTGPQARQW